MSRSRPDAGLVVALDGPGSSGKSSVGAGAARVLGYRFLDTGLLYRAITWLAHARDVGPDEIERLVELVSAIRLEADEDGRLARVLVEGEDRSEEIRSPEVDTRVSDYAKVPEVRASLLARQRELAAAGGIVVAGRDIGTVVLPDADVKVYLDASAEVRARRRAAERGFGPDAPETARIRDELVRRDEIDSTRAVAPLRAAADAVVLDSDQLDLEATIRRLVEIVRASGTAAGQATARARRGANEADSSRAPQVERPGRPIDPPGWFERLSHAFGRLVLPFLARVRRVGFDRPLPRSGALLVAANHLSNADPALVGSYLAPALGRRLFWLGKEEALRWPIIGWAIRQNGVMGVKRGGADLDAYRIAKEVLDAGHVLVVFPEGTRSRTGALGTAKDGVGSLALRTGAAILPVGMHGTERLWPRGRKLPTRTREVTIRIGAPFHLPPAPEGADRRTAGRAATDEIMARISELLPPEYRGAYADRRSSESPERGDGAPLP